MTVTDIKELVELALSVIKSGVDLFNRTTANARQNSEMTATEYSAWCAKRDAILAQPWHQVDPDPEPKETDNDED
mgnify:CR=1 FL=1